MIAKKASISILVIIFLTSCNFIFNNNNAGIEEVNFGTKKTELLKIKSFQENQTPRTIILVIGDGTGINHITLARLAIGCLLYTSPSPRDRTRSRMPSSA